MPRKPDHELRTPTAKACNGWKAKSKAYCTKSPGWGTDHVGIGRCKLHGGANPAYLAEVQRLAATRAVETYGIPVKVDPQQALVEELERTAGHVHWLRIQVADLEADDTLTGPVGNEGVNEAGVRSHPRAEAHIMLRLYQQERKHLVAVAKSCIEAGIEERRVKLAEDQGQLIAKAITGILKELGVDMTDPNVPKVVRRNLIELEAPKELQAA